jgi:ABC-2 type transport system ATP-binding protein
MSTAAARDLGSDRTHRDQALVGRPADAPDYSHSAPGTRGLPGPLGPETVIEVNGLRMSYDGAEAVRGIDLSVSRGEIFAFLGPNGAGKTTTVEILEGHRQRTAGEVRVLGEDPERADRWWRSRVGVVLQSSRVEPQLTVRECLELYAGYYPAPRSVPEVIELVGLKKRSEVRCGRLSGGQQRRVDVALALVGDPELVFLDEPTTGFDPSARRSAWEMIDGLRRLGKSIFLTTHYMDEAEALADRIAVIKAGVIIAQGTPVTLGGRDSAAYQITFSLPDGVAVDDLPVASSSGPQLGDDGRVLIESEQVMPTLRALSDWAIVHSYDISDMLVGRPALEDVYIRLTESPK